MLDTLKQKIGGNSASAHKDPAQSETLEPASDRYCDSLARSYTLTENVSQLSQNALLCKLKKCNPADQIPKDPTQFQTWLPKYSEKHLWLPLAYEENMGNSFFAEQQKAGLILDREAPAARKLYTKLDAALEVAKKSYPAIPYKIKLYIIDVTDLINAQAAPGGFIFVTRAAAKGLDEKSLQFVIGHEMAHLAKRHLSKQLQDRMIETQQAGELFKKLAARSDLTHDTEMAKSSVDRLHCSFAKYEVSQESQADACSVRVMMEASLDPLAAWQEYKAVRGTTSKQNTTPKRAPPGACVTSSTHPEDSNREMQLKNDAAHQRSKVLNKSAQSSSP